ncbi:FAD-binding oxidoreductase [Kutzneria chonburiensis]|uniref:Delta(24)-sterol reductase n=1 Tax=Kutzneria chonburiensis TaxID=1483604 RepID=A0ABV6MYF0_9PSEU|nr:FAD-binding oxidoreductase [Kutzneria chonburiensis]
MGNQAGGTAISDRHAADVAALRAQYDALPPGTPVRLRKPTSNLFRFRDANAHPGLDVSRFNQVLSVDPSTRTAQVGGMTTYEDLADATLRHGLMPHVVPQLKTITLGGAVSGLGIESSSFRNGLPHESVREMEILTGDGRVVVARADNEHAELFSGFPNSYGTLGYSLRLEIDLQPVKPFVRLRHVRFDNAHDCAAAIARICAERSYDGEAVEFIDGTVFSRGAMFLTLGDFVDTAPYTSDYTGQQIYYKSIPFKQTDYLTVRDYLWRWDTDWFWCSKALGVQDPFVRRFVPRKYLRSDVYRKIVALDRHYGLSRRVETLLHGYPSEPVIQDIEVPVDRLPEFLEFFDKEIGISPVWLCPLQVTDDRPWPLYPLDPKTLYVNVGFWSGVRLGFGDEEGVYNRRIERVVAELGGHKSLYSDSYYPPEEFWRFYNGEAYRAVKRDYDPANRLPDLYDKCVRGR